MAQRSFELSLINCFTFFSFRKKNFQSLILLISHQFRSLFGDSTILADLIRNCLTLDREERFNARAVMIQKGLYRFCTKTPEETIAYRLRSDFSVQNIVDYRIKKSEKRERLTGAAQRV